MANGSTGKVATWGVLNDDKKNKERGGKEPEWQVTCIFYSQVSSNTRVSSVYTDNNPGEYSSDYDMTIIMFEAEVCVNYVIR